MKVKVQCVCGTRFEFEVEPVNGRMPVAINCPVCNADDKELANAVIQQQSAAPVVGIAPAPVMPSAPPPPLSPPPAPQSGLRIAKAASAHAPPPAPEAAPAAPADSSEPTVQLCPKHKGEAAVDACVVCGKPICLKCMQVFGHVCSVFCRQQAEQKRIYIPVYAGQKSLVAEREESGVKLIAGGIALFVAAILGLWIYYAWFAREPKIVFSVPLGQRGDSMEQREARGSQFFKLIAPGQLFSIKDKQASLLDVSKGKPLWSTSLPGGSFADPVVTVTTNDLWLAFPGGLVRLDRQTGTRKDNPIQGRIISFSESDEALLVVFMDEKNQRTLARINLPDGDVQTAALTGSVDPNKSAVKIASIKKHAKDKTPVPEDQGTAEEKIEQIPEVTASMGSGAKPGSFAVNPNPGTITHSIEDEATSFGYDDGEILPFTASGQSVAQFQARLLEQKTVTHEAMKPKGKSVLDGNITASQGLELAQEMANDAQRNRTGGVDVEDVSRYQVTLHRWFAADAADWSGEVTGPPHFYALKTMDLLVAGQTVMAFDRHNKKLWEGKLSYPMNYFGDHPPVLETKDAVYVADPGVLNCFDLATGSVRWRVNSVGISSVLADASGKIYLNTTTAGPEKIKYSQEQNLHEKIRPVIMKVDPASGKVLWKQESIGNKCVFSGKFLFSTWVTQTQSALKLEEGPDTHFNLYLINPSDGSLIWNFHVDNQYIEATEMQQNWILLHFADNLYVLKFFSL